VSWKSTTEPRGADEGGRRPSNQSVKVSRAKAGSGRRRSMPATFSMSQRLGAEPAIQLEIGASLDPHHERRPMCPKSRLRSDWPLALW
jgi:hypothetical protein